MLSLAYSAAMLGIEGYVVRVEADSAAGTPHFAIIGLPDRALGRPANACARRSSTPASPIRRVSCSSISRRPTFARAARHSTSQSRWR